MTPEARCRLSTASCRQRGSAQLTDNTPLVAAEPRYEPGLGLRPRAEREAVHGRRDRRPRAGPLGLLCFGALCASAQPFDLDVGIPPGSPLQWGRAFPAITPGGGPLFPTTPAGDDPTKRARTLSRRPEMDVHLSGSFGLVRILTWDLAGHLTWITGELDPRPFTGKGGSADAPPLPTPADALYWVSLAPLLRLMLHPSAVSQADVVAHLLEIGEPVLGVLKSASSEGDFNC